MIAGAIESPPACLYSHSQLHSHGHAALLAASAVATTMATTMAVMVINLEPA